MINYEKRALKIGLGVNLFCSVAGLVFFFVTSSLSIFLDSFISIVLCVSTGISMYVSSAASSEPSEKYPLGRYAIENIFILFRSIMLITTIIVSTLSGISIIVDFCRGIEENISFNNLYLVIYAVVMSCSCFLITFVYRYYNKKLNNKSNIIRIEIMASLYDGIVTIVAISSLLAFANIPFLSSIAPIGDSITVIILSLVYIYKPIKELVEQVHILTDKRIHHDEEVILLKQMQKRFVELNFFDVYICDSGNIYNIYITYLPKNKENQIYIDKYQNELSSFLYDKYENSGVHLYCTKKKLHLL